MDSESIILIIKRMIALGKEPCDWVHLTIEDSPLNIVLKEVIKNNENN